MFNSMKTVCCILKLLLRLQNGIQEISLHKGVRSRINQQILIGNQLL